MGVHQQSASSAMSDVEVRVISKKPILPKASIVIVNTNELHHLKRGLPSICHQQYPDYEVIVVDNASTDGSVAFIEKEYPEVKILRNKENLGYTGANNVGFATALGEYIAVLNPDTRMEQDWLYQLILALEADPRAGLASGKVLLMDNPAQINSCGLDITYTGLSFLRGLGEPAEKYPRPEVIFGVAGSAFVIKRKVLDEIGGFDDLYFIYYDDTDLSLRANLAGYTCIYVPAAVGYHQYIFKFSARKCFLQERNRYLSLLKTLRWPTLFLLFPLFCLSDVIAWGYAGLQGREHLQGKFRSYSWLMTNWNQVLEARRRIQRLRRVSDRSLLNRFSSRVNFTNTTKPWIASLLSVIINPMVFILGNICRIIVFW
jgi:hypothetical protein